MSRCYPPVWYRCTAGKLRSLNHLHRPPSQTCLLRLEMPHAWSEPFSSLGWQMEYRASFALSLSHLLPGFDSNCPVSCVDHHTKSWQSSPITSIAGPTLPHDSNTVFPTSFVVSSKNYRSYRIKPPLESPTALATPLPIASKHTKFRLEPHHLSGNKYLHSVFYLRLHGSSAEARKDPRFANPEFGCVGC